MKGRRGARHQPVRRRARPRSRSWRRRRRPGTVVATRTIPEIGVTEWTLSNGVRVVVKPTDFKSDEVRLIGLRARRHVARARRRLRLGEVRGHRRARGRARPLRRAVAPQGAGGQGGVRGRRRSASSRRASPASGSPNDLETMFQMVHLRFTAPRRDDGAIRGLARAGDGERPEPAPLARGRLLRGSPRRSRPRTTGGASRRPRRCSRRSTSTRRSQFYRDRFADASGFTFVLVGNLDLDRTKALVETYLGSLPAPRARRRGATSASSARKGVAKKAVAEGTEPKARVSHHLPRQGDLVARHRERHAHARRGAPHPPARDPPRGHGRRLRRERGRQRRAAAAARVRLPRELRRARRRTSRSSRRAAFDEIKAIQTKGHRRGLPRQGEGAAAARARDEPQGQRLLAAASSPRRTRYGDDPKLIVDFDPLVEKVTSDRVRAAAKKYLASTQYVLGEMRPATAPAARP